VARTARTKTRISCSEAALGALGDDVISEDPDLRIGLLVWRQMRE
jgi:hypothetical protein